MIRRANSEDSNKVVNLLIASRMFEEDDSAFLSQLFRDYFDSKSTEGHALLLDAQDENVRAMAYFQPMAAADRVWDLTMIAVQPDLQGRGLGTQLLSAVEDSLREQGGRLLIVDTSSSAQYDLTRQFYITQGYHEEARIRDYWTDGDDKVVFRKHL